MKYNLLGQRFGKLTVIELSGANAHKERTWKCRCDCGKETFVNTYALVHGHTRSCGCLVFEISKEINKTHGQSNSKLAYAYTNMLTRCYNKNYKYYANYSGRGITVCDEWLGKYGRIRFFEWAKSNGFSPELTLDRIDVNGNYCPNNCRWATMKVQQNNRTNNSRYEYNGEVKTLAEWADYFGIKYATLQAMIKRHGFQQSIERILSHG